MGESRQELLAWMNDLLQLSYTKIELVGTGAAICQIFDSIYGMLVGSCVIPGDVPMSKLKFNSVQEYESVNNFKVLQKTFADHSIDKIIPVERLVKCKFQDNLEFLQWVKKYWDSYFPGVAYDAAGRRKGGAVDRAPKASKVQAKAAAPKTATNVEPTRVRDGRLARSASGHVDPSVVDDFQKQIAQLQVTVDGLEKERDFYFSKLRDVEIAVQSQFESDQGDEKTPIKIFCKDVQSILYSTEEGFELPKDDAGNAENLEPNADETF